MATSEVRNPAFFVLYPHLIAEHDIAWYGVFGQFESAVPPPSFLANPSLLPEVRIESKKEKALTLCKHCSAVASAVNSVLATNPRHSTIWAL